MSADKKAENRPMPADPKELAQAMFRQADRQMFGPVKTYAQRRKGKPRELTAGEKLRAQLPARLLIEHDIEGEIIPQRPRDGYINATLLCQRAGKTFGHYHESAQTRAFLDELSADIGIPISALVQIIKGGNEKLSQGTWVHPRVAIHLGQWLSPAFAVQVSKWVFDWMDGRFHDYMPEHLKRFLKNKSKIPHDHFSMLNEIYLYFLAPLEDAGIIPPDKIMPDISTGKMFSSFLRKRGIDPNDFPTYQHEFVDKSRPTVLARLYPNEYLAEFRKYFHEVWLPQRSQKYLEEKFPKALPYLPALLQIPRT